ncbi:MAG: O-methyltransferase [Bacteroidia bacterium]|nr:O-methyltransferase [Bacteroidia bacterium]MDW8302802.1 O-methyltransferase [Bacteroidia bacterium]
MDFLPPEIEEYARQHTEPEPELLQQLNRETHAKVLYPRMLSGHFQGRLLSLISKMIRPKYILEIGTYTGYSALCLAEGLQPDGKLITIDINEELESICHRYFAQSKYHSQIELRIGDARAIIPQLNYPFDLVFIDADKENYLFYYEMLIPKLPKGAFILADNVLWSGKVLNEEHKDKETQSLREFNTYLLKDIRVEKLLLPIRDGLMIIRVK